MGTKPKITYRALLVDDSADDRFFIIQTLNGFSRFKIIQELADGMEAIAYLSGAEKYSNRKQFPFPDLLLLDLKMPRTTGYEVLQWLKTQHFPRLTVVVLSGSILQQDVEISLSLGAQGFWAKTANPEKQRLIATEIEALLDSRNEAPRSAVEAGSAKGA